MDWVRYRAAVYASTRTYMPILALHGLEELGLKLHEMSVQGRWSEMPKEVSDEVVRIFAACGTYDVIVREIERRFGGAADSIDLNFPPGTEPGLMRELVTDIRRIPQAFESFASA